MDRTSRFLRFPKIGNGSLFPQQRMLMGSSAQSSSGVHWCRRRVKFNEVPENVPRFRRRSGRLWRRARSGSAGSGEGSGEASGEGLGGFGAKAKSGFNIRRRQALVQSRVRFNRVPEKVAREGVAGWCRAGSGSTGSGSGEGPGEA